MKKKSKYVVAWTTPTHQNLMEDAYKLWEDHGEWDQTQFIQNLPTNAHKVAVITGNLNYQVGNGGFEQWFDNGYGNRDAIYLIKDLLPKIGTPAALKVLELVKIARSYIKEYKRQQRHNYEYGDDGGSSFEDAIFDKFDNLDDKYYEVEDEFLADVSNYLQNLNIEGNRKMTTNASLAAELVKEAAPSTKVDPKNVPLAPGIKSKNLTLDEGGAAGTGKVTIEFTDVNKALDFYQNNVAAEGETKKEEEAPKEEGAPEDQQAPPAPQAPAQGQQPANLMGGAPMAPKASSLKNVRIADYGRDVAEDMFGAQLIVGDRVKLNDGRRAEIVDISHGNVQVQPVDGSIDVGTRFPVDPSSLTKWATPTITEFSKEYNGIYVNRIQNRNYNLAGNPWQIASHKGDHVRMASEFTKFSFVNESGIEMPIKLPNSIKVGTLIERPDNGEMVCFAGFIDKVADHEEDMFEDSPTGDTTSLDIHIEADPAEVEKLLDTIIDGLDVKEDGEKLEGGKGDGKDEEEFDEDQLDKGEDVEKEHTKDEDIAEEIAKDHLSEDDAYYDKLEDMEGKSKKEKKKSSLRRRAWVNTNNPVNDSNFFNTGDTSEIGDTQEDITEAELTNHLELLLEDPSISDQEYQLKIKELLNKYPQHSDLINSYAIEGKGTSNDVLSSKKTSAVAVPGGPMEESERVAVGMYAFHFEGPDADEESEVASAISSKVKEINRIVLNATDSRVSVSNTWDSDEYWGSGFTLSFRGSKSDIETALNALAASNLKPDQIEKVGALLDGYKFTSKTAADVSDEIPPAQWTTDESKKDTVDSQPGAPLPPKDSLNNAPGDVLFDSQQPQVGRGGSGQFQTIVNPTDKSVTVKFLEDEEQDALDKAIGQGAGAPMQQNPFQQNTTPIPQPGQPGAPQPKPFEETNSPSQF